ncbi:hypothetical protein, partial [Clavibacter michiganensis]|uniref:hypothetical protein n=1 Tax=Clavibacter michiganensis TaxID=28447 RepID=UPI002931B54D
MLSSPDRDDDLLQERLRALHDVWPGDPADDDPLRATRRATAAADADGTTAARPPGRGGDLGHPHRQGKRDHGAPEGGRGDRDAHAEGPARLPGGQAEEAGGARRPEVEEEEAEQQREQHD